MWHHKLHKGGALGARELADVGSGASMGIAALSEDLTINSITVSPTFRYEAKNATTGLWTATVGENLTGAGSGGTVGLDTPLLTDDEAVNGDGSRYWDSGSNALYAMGTKDFVIELVGKTPPNSSYMAATTNLGGSSPGWAIGSGSGVAERFVVYLRNDALALVSVFSDNLPDSTWYHAIVFFDRSGSAQWYVNGSASAAPTVVSSVSSAQDTNANNFLVGAYGTGSLPYGESFAYVAMWQRDAWLDTHLQASVAAERFAKLNGTWSSALAKGPDQSLLRNSVATLEKQGQSGGQKLFTVGARWPRIEKRPDKYGRYAVGYNSEGQHTNLLPYSQALDNAGWTKTRCTVTADSTTAPDGTTTADTIAEDGTAASSHLVLETIFGLTVGQKYTHQGFFKAINRQWICLLEQVAVTGTVGRYFNIVEGTVGIALGTAPETSFIRYIGDGWFHCGITFTADLATTLNTQIALAESNGGIVYDGLTQDSVYAWGHQLTNTAYPVSYIKTAGATVTRLSDRFQIDGLTLPSSGTLVSETLSENVSLGNVRYITISDATANNRVLPYRATSNLLAFVQTGGVTQANATSSIPLKARTWQEARMTYATDDVNMYVDGALGVNDSLATMPSGMTRLTIGVGYSGINQLEGLVRARLLSKPSIKNITDFGAIMAKSSAYVSTPAAVAQSTSYANVGGTFTEVNSSDFTLTAAGVFTYTGTATKRFACFAAMSGSISSGNPQVTTVWEKNGTAVTSTESVRDIGSSAIGAWGVAGDIELANGDTLNLATKVDTGTPNFTAQACSVVIVEAGN